MAVHIQEVHAIALGNAGASRPAINLQSSQHERGFSVGSPDKTLRQVHCLWCIEWGHAVSKSLLFQLTAQGDMARHLESLL